TTRVINRIAVSPNLNFMKRARPERVWIVWVQGHSMVEQSKALIQRGEGKERHLCYIKLRQPRVQIRDGGDVSRQLARNEPVVKQHLRASDLSLGEQQLGPGRLESWR